MDLNRRELLKAVPALAALAATASSLAEDLAPVSGTRDSGVMHGPAPAATTTSNPAVRLEPIALRVGS